MLARSTAGTVLSRAPGSVTRMATPLHALSTAPPIAFRQDSRSFGTRATRHTIAPALQAGGVMNSVQAQRVAATQTRTTQGHRFFSTPPRGGAHETFPTAKARTHRDKSSGGDKSYGGKANSEPNTSFLNGWWMYYCLGIIATVTVPLGYEKFKAELDELKAEYDEDTPATNKELIKDFIQKHLTEMSTEELMLKVNFASNDVQGGYGGLLGECRAYLMKQTLFDKEGVVFEQNDESRAIVRGIPTLPGLNVDESVEAFISGLYPAIINTRPPPGGEKEALRTWNFPRNATMGGPLHKYDKRQVGWTWGGVMGSCHPEHGYKYANVKGEKGLFFIYAPQEISSVSDKSGEFSLREYEVVTTHVKRNNLHYIIEVEKDGSLGRVFQMDGARNNPEGLKPDRDLMSFLREKVSASTAPTLESSPKTTCISHKALIDALEPNVRPTSDPETYKRTEDLTAKPKELFATQVTKFAKFSYTSYLEAYEHGQKLAKQTQSAGFNGDDISFESDSPPLSFVEFLKDERLYNVGAIICKKELPFTIEKYTPEYQHAMAEETFSALEATGIDLNKAERAEFIKTFIQHDQVPGSVGATGHKEGTPLAKHFEDLLEVRPSLSPGGR